MDSVSSKGVDKNKSGFTVRFDYRIVSVVLLVVIAVMLAMWQPWNAAPSSSARTISVTGNATVKATPDEYVFYPSYQLKDADKATASQMATDKQNGVVAGLKKLGITDAQIKADSAGYNSYYDSTNNDYNYTVSITVTVDSKALSQKVQDYLLATTPDGQITPSASFSAALQKKLEAQARDQATKDARAKAEQSAKNLGFEVGKVKNVDDSGFGGGSGCGGGMVCPMTALASGANDSSAKATQSLTVQSGQNELDYTVTVVYYVK